MSEFRIKKIVNKNKGDVHIGDVNGGGRGEETAKESRKWDKGHTLTLIGIIVAVVIGIIGFLT